MDKTPYILDFNKDTGLKFFMFVLERKEIQLR